MSRIRGSESTPDRKLDRRTLLVGGLAAAAGVAVGATVFGGRNETHDEAVKAADPDAAKPQTDVVTPANEPEAETGLEFLGELKAQIGVIFNESLNLTPEQEDYYLKRITDVIGILVSGSPEFDDTIRGSMITIKVSSDIAGEMMQDELSNSKALIGSGEGNGFRAGMFEQIKGSKADASTLIATLGKKERGVHTVASMHIDVNVLTDLVRTLVVINHEMEHIRRAVEGETAQIRALEEVQTIYASNERLIQFAEELESRVVLIDPTDNIPLDTKIKRAVQKEIELGKSWLAKLKHPNTL